MEFAEMDPKRSSSTIEFFVSIANIVKKLPQDEQEQVEASILDMIREAEIEYHKELKNKSSTDNDNTKSQITINSDLNTFDEDEFAQRVKFETGDNELVTQNDIMDTSSNSCFTSDTQRNITPTEQYVVKIIPEAESSEIHEEYIINVLPDDETITMPHTNAGIKAEPDATEITPIKDELDEIHAV